MEEIRCAADLIKRRLDNGEIDAREAEHAFANLEQVLLFATFLEGQER